MNVLRLNPRSKNIIAFFCVGLLIISSALFGKDSGLFDNVNQTALVLHGGNTIEVGNLSKIVNEDAASAGYAVGGMLGGLFANSLGSKFANPEVQPMQRKPGDLDNQIKLNALLNEWKLSSVFLQKFQLLLNSFPNHQVHTIPSDRSFLSTIRESYTEGDKYFSRNEVAYDYSSLMAEGITRVIEISLTGLLLRTNKEYSPAIFCQTRVIDMQNKNILGMTQNLEKYLPNTQPEKFEVFFQDQGSITKTRMEQLAQNLSEKLMNKTTGKK